MTAAFRRRLREEHGQAVVFVVVGLALMIGMAALVIDGGSWLRTQRQLQTAADAAALGGAQNLPTDQAGAQTVALNLAQQNFNGVAASVTFPSAGEINVAATTTASGIFAPVISAVFSSVSIHAHARAAVTVPAGMGDVAPVAVKASAACAATNPACYGQTITLSFDESQIASSTIGLLNLTCHSSVSTGCGSSSGIGGSQIKDWLETGYPDALPANQWYGVKTGETVGPVKQGFNDRVGVPLYFPVFDQVATSGSNNFFHIVGWAAFVIHTNGVTWSPQTRQLTGHFTTFIATDLASGGTVTGATDFGVHVISLTQ